LRRGKTRERRDKRKRRESVLTLTGGKARYAGIQGGGPKELSDGGRGRKKELRRGEKRMCGTVEARNGNKSGQAGTK